MKTDEKTSIFYLTVRYNETDAMGVVNNACYLDWFSEGRVCWIKDRGQSYRDWESQGICLPLIEVKVVYRQFARFEDELRLICRCDKMTRRSMEFSYSLYREDVLIAEGLSRHIFLLDGRAGKISPLLYNSLSGDEAVTELENKLQETS
jgi:acyl-CoA thioester hydrolase